MTVIHHLRVHRSDEHLAREGQLAWRIAEVAADPVEVEPEVVDMIINRVIDNAAVAAASLTRAPVSAARQQALDHAVSIGGRGATVFGCPLERRTSPEWAAWANGVAVRELDYHDTFLAADYSHPGDNIPPILAVAQHVGADGAALVRGLATGLRDPDRPGAGDLPAQAQDRPRRPPRPLGRGRHRHAARASNVETIYQAVGQALHTTTATRQSRKGEISTWKAHAPAFAGKMAVEAVDRAMRGETSPSPIYEGEDGVIAWMLDGPDAAYEVPLPGRGRAEARHPRLVHEGALGRIPGAGVDRPGPQARTVEHPRASGRDPDGQDIESIVLHTSHHTHYVIGSGANDPQKYDPTASRETLDHSIPYIFTVALQDGAGTTSTRTRPSAPRGADTVALWHKVTTAEDEEWTRRYHSDDPNEKAFGGRVVIRFTDGSGIAEEIAVADAHPLGARPFAREDYIRKFRLLAEPRARAAEEIERFLDLAQRLPELTADEVQRARPIVAAKVGRARAQARRRPPKGLF